LPAGALLRGFSALGPTDGSSRRRLRSRNPTGLNGRAGSYVDGVSMAADERARALPRNRTHLTRRGTSEKANLVNFVGFDVRWDVHRFGQDPRLGVIGSP